MEAKSNSNPLKNPIPGPFVPRTDHNPRELKSWAKRTGFKSSFSGETATSTTDTEEQLLVDDKNGNGNGGGSSSPKIEIDPILGRTRGEIDIEPISRGLRDGLERVGGQNTSIRVEDQQPVGELKKKDERSVGSEAELIKKVEEEEEEVRIHGFPEDDGVPQKRFELRCGLRENPGFVSLLYYGVQHYLSLAGSLVFIPLIIVPAMGGTDKDTATVISTMLLVTGFTTIMHSYFGTRLPLVQGSSFVFLAPALVVLNSKDYRNLTEHKFKHIMKELQGAIIVGSVFQSILGYSGFMCLLLRLINPVVVAPTVAAIGLAFFSYGFPQAGNCVEISIPLILLVLIFTLYLRGVSVYGHRIFRVYAVPLSVVIVWMYAFFLTAAGAYNYKGCDPNIPSSNILYDSCRQHVFTMQHCRTDASNAWTTANWVRIPYPLQWGIPTFHFRTSILMIIVSLISSVDSVGTYHSASLLVNGKPPTPGIVSRGIGLEGLCSVLAGLWGTTTGSTTLTENTHTIEITKVGNRKAIELGAVFLILFSFIGKVGALIAAIPQALAASILCFVWALIMALGLSNLQYSPTRSFRNITIIGVSLFFSLSIPAYFQQYQQPSSTLILPSYFVPYAAASNGPIHTGNKQIDFAINGLLSMTMVIAFALAFLLDNTVPGSKPERGVYVWSNSEEVLNDPSLMADYSLPRKVARCFKWAKCVGV